MGLEKNGYKIYKALNRDVIKPAIKEINGLTDYYVEVEQKRCRGIKNREKMENYGKPEK